MRFRQNSHVKQVRVHAKYRNLGNEVSPELTGTMMRNKPEYRNLGNEVSPELPA